MNIREIIKNIILEENNKFIIEGVDIDEKNKTVSFNPNHEDNVDTSDIINPTFTTINDNINVISIFKRKNNLLGSDGNPLVYALKNEKGWKFKNEKQDIINLLKQFIKIVNKIEPKYDTIITIPSNNPLNVNFLHRLNNILKSDHQITDYLHKLQADVVFEDYINFKGIFEFSNDEKLYQRYISQLKNYFNDMVENNNNMFSYKMIKNNDLRDFISKTMYQDVEKTLIYSELINNKNILILDDTISKGHTISEGCNVILNTFKPKSITVITLLSKV